MERPGRYQPNDEAAQGNSNQVIYLDRSITYLDVENRVPYFIPRLTSEFSCLKGHSRPAYLPFVRICEYSHST